MLASGKLLLPNTDFSMNELRMLTMAPGVWRSYGRLWRRIWDACQPKLLQRQLAPTVQNLHAHSDILFGFVAGMFSDESVGEHTLSRSLTVANKAFELHNLPRLDRHPDAIALRGAAARFKSKPVVKKTAIAPQEVACIVGQWGAASAPAWRRTVALCCALMFDCVLRYDDMASLRVGCILWMPGGCLLGLTLTKTNQKAAPQWLPLADAGTETCTYARLRRELRLRGFVVPRRSETGFIKTARPTYVWPSMRSCGGGRWSTVETHRPLKGEDSAGYRHFRDMFKGAMRECCRYPEDVLALFSTHSMRRGGNTFNFEKGLSKEVRMQLGRWKTPSVEAGYLALSTAYLLQCSAAAVLR